MDKYLEHFKKVDPILFGLAQTYELKMFNPPKDYFASLTRKIVGQQLSVKAATTIFTRFQSLFPNEQITASELLKIPDDRIRQAGISRPKINYLKGMATDILDEKVVLDGLDKLTDDQIIELLTKLKGFGKWSAEMFLMFDLKREDVFSSGDLGILRALEKHYGLQNPSREEMEKLALKWSPYRTYACRILWSSLETK